MSRRARIVQLSDLHLTAAGVPVHACPSTAYQFRPGSLVPAAVARRGPAFSVIDLDGEAFTTRVEEVGG